MKNIDSMGAMMSATTTLINGLKVLLASDDCDCKDAVLVVAAAIAAAGLEAEIVSDDPDLSEDEQYQIIFGVSEHTLVIDGDPVVTWTRAAAGQWGDPTRQGSDDEWVVTEDTTGGDVLPAAVAVALEALGLEDTIPDIPRPPLATEIYSETPDGVFSVCWETVGEEPRVIARYDDLEAARAVREQKQREFVAKHPSNNGYLCGYTVRKLNNVDWEEIDEE